MSRSVSEIQGSAAVSVVDLDARAENASSSGVRPAIRAVCNRATSGEREEPRAAQTGGVPAAPESERTIESHRAEAASHALQSGPRKLVKARSEFVRRFDAIMTEHRMRGETAYSNGAVARACGVDEKTVRQWRNGEKPLRAEVVALFPGRLRDEVLALIRELDGRGVEPGIVQLAKSLDVLDSQVTAEDASVLDHAIGRLVGMKRKAMGDQ